jgi:two-component system sensor histidine kinase UhpB
MHVMQAVGRAQARPEASRHGRLSLLTRVFLANAAVLAVATLLLLFSPVTVSAPIKLGQALILVAGFLVALILNLVLLLRVTAPLRRLTSLMGSIDPLRPGRRLRAPRADAEVSALAAAFNEMLDRLETERRESALRALAAQENERRRVARELHDEVGQSLTAAMLEIEDARRSAYVVDEPRLAAARESVRASLDDLRRIARQLRPAALDDLGLQSALRSLCTQTVGHGRLAVERRFAVGPSALPRDVELVVYRVAQESLTNVVRHAQASRALVALQPAGDGIRLTVSDDGRGLPDMTSGEGSGIAGMRERALLIGGRLTITSSAGTGTEVRLDVPLPETDT